MLCIQHKYEELPGQSKVIPKTDYKALSDSHSSHLKVAVPRRIAAYPALSCIVEA